MNEIAQAMTAETFEEKYGDMMLNGLSSIDTYIPLRTNARLGLNVAIRPMVVRLNDQVVLFGGKLRVGFTLNADKTPVKSKVTALNAEAAEAQLTGFCKGFSWQRQSARRFSTVIGVGVAATRYDGDLALENLLEDGIAADFINRLEATYKKYNDGAKFPSKRKATAALQDAWLLQAKGVFSPLPETQQLPDEVVGITSKVLNQAQDSYGDNVVAFKAKVEEKAASIPDPAEDEE